MELHLGDWRIEPSLNRISRPGAEVRLEPKVMALLVLLTSRANDVVTKEEITEHLWPGTFVTESSIFRHVSELRRALGEDRKHPRYIETIPKKGYRAIVPGPAAAEAPRTKITARRALRLAIAIPAAVAGVVVSFGVAHRGGEDSHAGPAARSGARDAYVRGELFENRVDCASFDRAIDLYSEAIERDEAFVEVYPRLFDALVASAVLGCQPAAPLFSRLESLLEASVRNGLNETGREQGRAALELWRDFDTSAALARFRAAEAAASTRSTEDLSLAVALLVSERPEEGLREARRCLDALPIDLGENWALGTLLYLAGRYDEAVDQLLATLELYPNYRPARQILALSYLMKGDAERAVDAAEHAEPSRDERWARFDAVPAYVYARTGGEARARRILREWQARMDADWVPKWSLALIHAGLGEDEQARLWLERARREQDPWTVVAALDPAFQPHAPPPQR